MRSLSSVQKESQAFLLWQKFMPRKKEIQATKGPELYALTIYPEDYFENFDPVRTFEKWAAVEVVNVGPIPQGMEQLTLVAGLYVVFTYKGSATEAYKAFHFIFQDWLPSSAYRIDHRPHLAVMGENYKNNDPDSEEEFWIPIRKR